VFFAYHRRLIGNLNKHARFFFLFYRRMKGSTVDASECDRNLPHILLHIIALLTRLLLCESITVSDAIDGAEVMLYCVSLAYKESANCRECTSCPIQYVCWCW
jgi:hypothetical protein